MTNTEFVKRLREIATNYKTLYVMGCFGAPMTEENKQRYINNGAHNNYNASVDRKAIINAASADTFGFDCVCLLKGVLWGWNGDKNKAYGGATYAANGVPDIDTDSMIAICSGTSTDFSKIEVGEAVWMSGHIGVYIGDGLAAECTPSWKNKVQITACNCTKDGYNRRNWTKHGKLPYISYTAQKTTASVSGNARSGVNGYIAGNDIPRTADTIVAYYTGTSGKTGTNQWGCEVQVDRFGVVQNDPKYGRCNLEIPAGGKVLSGHGAGSDWILGNLRAGYLVWITDGKIHVNKKQHRGIDAVNGQRLANFLCVYNKGTATGTNPYGYEVPVGSDGKALAAPRYAGNTEIPKGGFALSGHGDAGKWIYANVKKGTKVSITDTGNVVEIGS